MARNWVKLSPTVSSTMDRAVSYDFGLFQVQKLAKSKQFFLKIISSGKILHFFISLNKQLLSRMSSNSCFSYFLAKHAEKR
jgi:hypothetical protein